MKKLFVIGVLIFATGLMRAHPITVDGDPSDWIGIGADTAVVDSGEWIVEDALYDDWGDGGDAPYTSDNPEAYSYPTSMDTGIADIEEVRYTINLSTSDTGTDYFYGLVRMADLSPNTIVTLFITVDTTFGNNYVFDSSDVATALKWNLMVVFNNGNMRILNPLGQPFVTEDTVAFNYSNGIIEFGISLDSLPEPQGWYLYTAIYAGVADNGHYAEVDSLASQTHGGGGTNSIYDPDIYDIVAPDSASQVAFLSSYTDSQFAIIPNNLFFAVDLRRILPFIPASIEEIQGHADSSPYVGMTVMTWGIVYAVFSHGFFIQDVGDSGNTALPWNGLYVYTGSTPTVSRGDAINIVAEVDEYHNLTELKNISSIEVIDSGNYIEPAVVPTGDLSDEQWEGVYVKVDSAICTNPDLGYGEWEINDGTGPVRVDDMGYSFNPDSGHSYMVQGPLYYSYGNFKIEPRDSNDVVDLTYQPPTIPEVKINEILYDTPGADHGTFTEIVGQPGTSLDNVYLVGINGSNGQVYAVIDLSGNSIPASGYFVVAQDTSVSNANMVNPSVDWQNGPDNVLLAYITTNDTIILDAVGYGSEDTTTWHFFGEGVPAVDVRPGYSLARIPDSVDNDCNTCDFSPMPPTPGFDNGQLLYYDGFENGASNWTGDWGVTSQTSHTGNYSYTDSPNGNYPDDTTLVGNLLISFDLTQFRGAYLQFYDTYWIEQGFDYGYIDISTDGGATWTSVASFTGTMDHWKLENIDLSPFCGNSNVQIRFRLVSDMSYNENGWFVDDVKVIGSYVDASPPMIVHTPLADTTSVMDSLTLTAQFLDPSGIMYDSLYYSLDSNWFAATADSSLNRTWYYTIHGLTPGTFIEYYFVAADSSGNRAVSDHYTHIAGKVLYEDDGEPGYITLPDPGDSIAVRFNYAPAGSLWVTTLLYNFYMDSNHGLDTVIVHIWDSLGNEMIQPIRVYPVNTLDNPFAWTAVDIRNENLYVSGNTPFYVGVEYRDTIPAILLDNPGSFNSSYRFRNGTWHALSVDFFIRAIVGTYGVDVSEGNVPNRYSFKLFQNIPNPVKSRTTISFVLPRTERVQLTLYDVTGRAVRTLLDRTVTKGVHSVNLNTNGLRSGIYFYELRTRDRVKTRKMIILK